MIQSWTCHCGKPKSTASVLIVVCQILGAMQVVGVVPRQWALIVCQMQEALQVEVALYQRVLTACQLLEAMWVEWALCL